MKRPILLLLAFSTACAHASREAAARTDAAPAGIASSPAQAAGTAPQATPPIASGEPRPEPQDLATSAPVEEQAAAEPSSVPGAAAQADARERLIRAARKHLGRRFAGDCSAFVRRVFAEARVVLPELRAARTMTESLYRSMWPVAKPAPGDLAYFRRTRRHDRGGKDRYGLSHVAIVEAVDGARVTMIHRSSRGIRRLEMNLDHPHDRDENDVLRRPRPADGRSLPSLASELFVGYATALLGKHPAPGILDSAESASSPRPLTHGRRPPRP